MDITMSNKKQSSVDFIFNAFNLLSDSDFKAWMLNNHGVIKAMHKEEIQDAWLNGMKGEMIAPLSMNNYKPEAEQYYNETF
jgi:hypothetical protein